MTCRDIDPEVLADLDAKTLPTAGNRFAGATVRRVARCHARRADVVKHPDKCLRRCFGRWESDSARLAESALAALAHRLPGTVYQCVRGMLHERRLPAGGVVGG